MVAGVVGVAGVADPRRGRSRGNVAEEGAVDPRLDALRVCTPVAFSFLTGEAGPRS